MCGFQYTNPLCDNILFLIAGPNSNQLNATRVPVYVAHTPAGTSTQNIQHFGQDINTDLFGAFDFGKEQNLVHYHQASPPVYDLAQMRVPTYLYWGDLDILADPADVKFIVANVPNLKASNEMTDFNHLDFIWGLRAANEIYNPIIDTIKALQVAKNAKTAQ